MKKYIQPQTEILHLQMEGTIAASERFKVSHTAADSDALSNKRRDIWGGENKEVWK